MAEYWKSTPKYYCKYCETYVKDTKLERTQHEATGRHQGNIQRSLKNLHRAQENEERDKARAQAEVARLNGLVPSASTSSVATGLGAKSTFEKRPEKKATLEDRKRQWEQLVAMGIAVPEAARTDMGLASEWKTVSKKIVGEVNDDGEFKAVSLNKGVRKRMVDEDDEERVAAGELITKKKGWGNTYKAFPGSKGAQDDVESLFGKKAQKEGAKEDVKEEAEEDDGVKAEAREESDTKTLQDIPTAEEAERIAAKTAVKSEDAPSAPAVVFKKRKKILK